MNQQRQRCADGGKLAAHGKGNAAYACQQQRIGQRAQAGQTVQQREKQRNRAAADDAFFKRRGQPQRKRERPDAAHADEKRRQRVENERAWHGKERFLHEKIRLSGVDLSGLDVQGFHPADAQQVEQLVLLLRRFACRHQRIAHARAHAGKRERRVGNGGREPRGKDGDRSGSAHARRGKEQHAGKVVLTVVTRGSQRAAHGVKRFHALPGKLALPR